MLCYRISLKNALTLFGLIFSNFCFLWLPVCGTLSLCLMLFTPWAFVPLAYVGWMIYDQETPKKGGRPSSLFRELKIWQYYADYFPVTLHKTCDVDTNKNYIFGYHPHGVLVHGGFAAFNTAGAGFPELFPGIKRYSAVLGSIFKVPFLRDIWLACGAISVDRESLEYVLTKNGTGNFVGIAVGGAVEAYDAVPNTMVLTIKNRKGFVKLAIQYGASLIPCISFGENELYYQKRYAEGSIVKQIQNKAKDLLGFSLPLAVGRALFLPFSKPVHVVVGKPIDVNNNENPSREEVNNVHKAYMDALAALFEENKSKYAENANMKIEFK